jgi:hypothetical protein
LDWPNLVDQVEFHKGIYRRLSNLDHRLQEGGVSVVRRQALWAALAADPMMREIMNSRVTSAELRHAIQADLAECGRLRAEAFEADSQWVASSVYEALLAFFYLTVDSDEFVFRGHMDAEWTLVPSFFRMQPRVSIQLLARMIYGAYRWAEKQAEEPLGLTPFGTEAAAQHYGSGTTLLDVTQSMRVAAYFATNRLHRNAPRPDCGALFILSVEDLSSMGRGVLRSRDLPECLTRIHRTKGAFVSGLKYSDKSNEKLVTSAVDIVDWLNREAQFSELTEFGLGIWEDFLASPRTETAVIRFRQTGDEFSDDVWNINRSYLGGASPAGPRDGAAWPAVPADP